MKSGSRLEAIILILVLAPVALHADGPDDPGPRPAPTLREKVEPFLRDHLRLPADLSRRLDRMAALSKSEVLDLFDVEEVRLEIESTIEALPEGEFSAQLSRAGLTQRSSFAKWLIMRTVNDAANEIKDISEAGFQRLIQDARDLAQAHASAEADPRGNTGVSLIDDGSPWLSPVLLTLAHGSKGLVIAILAGHATR